MDERNWISDLKTLGNRWADQEAGSTVAPNSTMNTPSNENIKGKLKDKTTGSILEWGYLHKMVRIQRIQARQDRLAAPSKACFIFGQGNYSREALVDRSLMWGTLLKKFSTNKIWHFPSQILGQQNPGRSISSQMAQRKHKKTQQ